MSEIELFICIKMDLALNNLKRLICHKTQTNSQSICFYRFISVSIFTSVYPYIPTTVWLILSSLSQSFSIYIFLSVYLHLSLSVCPCLSIFSFFISICFYQYISVSMFTSICLSFSIYLLKSVYVFLFSLSLFHSVLKSISVKWNVHCHIQDLSSGHHVHFLKW